MANEIERDVVCVWGRKSGEVKETFFEDKVQNPFWRQEKMILHCMKKTTWEERKSKKYWGKENIAEEGFIHCSTIE